MFVPSQHGCAFANSAVIGRSIRLGPVPLGRVIGGLCGGMCLEALRRYHRGEPRPQDNPRDLASVFRSQLRSFDFTRAPVRYAALQHPAAAPTRYAVTVDETIPLVRRRLADHRPVLLALISSLGTHARTLTQHHVVLATAILAQSPAKLTVAIYDPNYPGDDTVTLTLRGDGRPHQHSRGRQVYAAFGLLINQT